MNLLSLLLQEKAGVAKIGTKKNIYPILWQHELNSNASTLYNHFKKGSLLLTTTPLGVPGTLFIDLTMKPPSGVKTANPGLVIGKQIIHYSLILPRRCIKYLKCKLNMITKTYLYPITTSDHSNSISSHHIMA